MEKKARIFRYIVANVVLIGALLATIIYVVPLVGAAQPVDEPYFRGVSETEVAIMFKVDRNNSCGLDSIIEVLNKHNKVATFFVSGSWVLENSDSLEKLVEYGHQIGNGGFFESHTEKLSAAKIREEIELNHKLVYAVTRRQMDLFTPPSNYFLPTSLDIARALGYTTIAGSNAPIKASDTSAQVLANIIANINPGDFIMLPTTSIVAGMLDKLLQHIAQQELVSTTAGALLRKITIELPAESRR